MLGARGYREYVSSVQSDNLPALRYAYGGSRRLVERVELLHYVCLLGFRYTRLDADALVGLERRLAEHGRLPGAA